MASHIVLLGDSIFDNGSYVGRAPDVLTHLRNILPAPWEAMLCAVDGSTTAGLASQLRHVPASASHLVISTGGNDARQNCDLLDLRVGSTAEALAVFGERVRRFEASYRSAIDGALALKRRTTVCTIYNGNLDSSQAQIARIALTMFNDVILRVAIEHRISVIDLRLVCTDAADYANPIEPSGSGGRKIAEAIARSVLDTDASHAKVYAG